MLEIQLKQDEINRLNSTIDGLNDEAARMNENNFHLQSSISQKQKMIDQQAVEVGEVKEMLCCVEEEKGRFIDAVVCVSETVQRSEDVGEMFNCVEVKKG